MRQQVLEADRLGVGLGDVKIQIGLDVRLEVELALLDELHHGRRRERLSDRGDAEQVPVGIDRDALFEIREAVAFLENNLAPVNHRDGQADQRIGVVLRDVGGIEKLRHAFAGDLARLRLGTRSPQGGYEEELFFQRGHSSDAPGQAAAKPTGEPCPLVGHEPT